MPKINNIPYFTGEFWSSKQRQGNPLHEISYRACFKPELPEFFINSLTNEGDTVYDPFMGRGTTPLQASMMNRFAIGNDANPLSKMLVEPRLNPPTMEQIEERLNEIDFNHSIRYTQDLLVFYHRKTLLKLESLKSYLLCKELDSVDKWIRMVALNRLTGHSTGFFSVYTMPPNQSVSLESQMKINEKRNQIPPERDIKEIILKKSRSLLKHSTQGSKGNELFSMDATNNIQIKDSSVDLVVTSPPFLDVVDYKQDNWLRCWFADIDIEKLNISTPSKIKDWENFINSTLKELSRVVKVGGHVVFEVGEVRNGKLKLDEYVISAVMGLPLKVLGVMVNQQNFTKTSNIWGIDNNLKGTNSNRIVVMRRE